ncbi:MAG TPA: ABC transporter substrate-binding protein, partial [Desulfobacteria bacterium]|nr:ABC transporter substrate-binding protein [Desulfobacteria bacterium]
MLRNRKLLSLLIGLLIIGLFLTGCGSQSATKSEGGKEPYKVGVILDISGPGSSLGIPERDTVVMIAEEINKSGGINGHPIELLVEDNKSDETESKLLVKKLVDQGALAIVGSSTSGTSMAMTGAATNAEIPMVSAAANEKIVTPVSDRKWVFKTAQSDSLVVEKIITYLKSKGLTKIAFASVNSKFGDGGRAVFEAAAANAGITILGMEKFGEKDVDMTPQITNIKKLNPQAVISWAIPPAASIFTKNYRELDVAAPLIESHGIGNKKFIELAGDTADGVIFPIGKLLVAEGLPDTDPQKAVLVDYATKFEAKYGARNTFGGHAWDSLKIVMA